MLPFIPRKVARSLNQKQTHSAFTTSHTPGAGSTTLPSDRVIPQESPSTPKETASSKGKQKATETPGIQEEEYATLLSMSMSDYALWFDTDLRRTIEFAEDGFFPLVYLIDRMPLPERTKTPPPEALLVKAIRTYAPDAFDVRMLISSPSRSLWYGGNASRNDGGGYEICLKDWKDVIGRVGSKTRHEWDKQTLYMENIPPRYRSLAGIHRFVSNLLREASSTDVGQRIQHVSLPRHHQDKPADQPKCKGFALVTLFRTEDIGVLLRQWPWQRQPTEPVDAADYSTIHQDAARFGFRTTPKAHWDALNAEYMAYRQKLLDELTVVEETEEHAHLEPSPALETVLQEPESQAPMLDLSAPYPPGCLAYVRNVHPETNKTTLRKLFAQASAESVSSSASSDGIDYVDFNKGMDTCHLRLATPQHTEHLAKYFSEHHLIQAQGLDGVGTEKTESGRKPLSFEVVTGEREGLYWGKVPEKVRRQAVEKAILGRMPPTDRDASGEGRPTKRKRRRMK